MRLSDFLTRSRAVLALAAAGAIALSACSAQEPTADPSATESASAATTPEAPTTGESSADALPTSAVTPSPDLSGITVTDTDVPEVTVPAPWGIATTQTKVLRESSSAQVVGENAGVTVNYVGVNGRTGEVFDSSYERGTPVPFSLDAVVPGFKTGLAGQKVGSRVLIGMTGDDGYKEGRPQAGIEAGDSLVFVVDIVSATFDEPVGEEIAPAEGVPSVTVTDGVPEITIPEGMSADSLVVQPLIKGPGAAIAADSVVTLKFRAWGASSGKEILNGWGPQTAPLNTLLPGWQTGLLEQTAGSRVLMVVPAENAYPGGLPDKGLPAGEGMVFVIDIVDVQAPQQQ